MAHHHVGEEFAQPATVLGQARVTLHDEATAELARRLELARLEDGDQVIQFVQAVLHRRSGEHQDVLLLKRVDELPGDAGAVLEMVRLIHDHQVVDDVLDDAAVFATAGRGQRGDHAGESGPRLRPQLAELRVVVGDEVGQAKLARQFLPPLLDQGGRGDDEHTVDHLAQQVLLEH